MDEERGLIMLGLICALWGSFFAYAFIAEGYKYLRLRRR